MSNQKEKSVIGPAAQLNSTIAGKGKLNGLRTIAEQRTKAGDFQTTLDNLNERVTEALVKRDESELPWLQLELALSQLNLLRAIDYKFWETYKKFVQ
jgi:hypothetical protein